MTAKANRGKTLDAADQELWARFASDIAPLKRKRTAAPKAAKAEAAPGVELPKAAPREKPATVESPARAVAAPRGARPPDLPLPAGGGRRPVPGLDKRTAERLRKGEIPIEAKLDLHGMTQAEASAALSRFVRQSRLYGLRCLLVITGKGERRRAEEDVIVPAMETGVLKQLVPRWLSSGAERQHILAIATARPQHGGAGALYVLLRRSERR
jgi:DNA-nicking Smr family endonuclease